MLIVAASYSNEALGLKIEILQKNLKLHPWPADLIFGRKLHFLAKLSKN